MPPKKKDKKKRKDGKEEVEGYDVSSMTVDQLKKYARMLEQEIGEMRKHCSFYQSAKDKLSQFYQTRQWDLQEQESRLLRKDIEIEEIQHKVQQDIIDKEQNLAYRKFASIQHGEKVTAKTEARIADLTKCHENKLDRLKEEFSENKQALEENIRRVDLLKKVTMQRADQKIQALEEHEEQLLAESTDTFTRMVTDMASNFNFHLESIEAEALEIKRFEELEFHNACLSYKEKLQEYFKSITKEDLAIIKELKQKKQEIKENIKKSKTKLKHILNENEELKITPERKFVTRTKHLDTTKIVDSDFKLSKTLHNQGKVQKLKKENEIIE